jgi:hypothetical protein
MLSKIITPALEHHEILIEYVTEIAQLMLSFSYELYFMKSKFCLARIVLLVLTSLPAILTLTVFIRPSYAEVGKSSQEITPSNLEVFEYTISITDGQEFENLMQEASRLAEGFIDQGFATNPSATEVFVMILGDHHGQITPLLRVLVSRDNWRSQPRIEHWARYMGRPASYLLGLAEESTITSSYASGSDATVYSNSSEPSFVPISSSSSGDDIVLEPQRENSDPGYR